MWSKFLFRTQKKRRKGVIFETTFGRMSGGLRQYTEYSIKNYFWRPLSEVTERRSQRSHHSDRIWLSKSKSCENLSLSRFRVNKFIHVSTTRTDATEHRCRSLSYYGLFCHKLILESAPAGRIKGILPTGTTKYSVLALLRVTTVIIMIWCDSFESFLRDVNFVRDAMGTGVGSAELFNLLLCRRNHGSGQ